eukprot:Hpha_TRINITY_DN32103_c0_g1::TRINITY_DN32103_c0_g1_i1::g.18520::m.18520
MSTAPSMYVRIKRFKTTIFLHCEPSDSIRDLKERCAQIEGIPVAEQRLKLGKQNLEDATSLHDNNIGPQDVGVVLVLAKLLPQPAAGGRDDDWEDAALITAPAEPEPGEAAPPKEEQPPAES